MIDRVGDHQPACLITAHQSQVDHKLTVIGGHVTERPTRQDRLDDATHARFTQSLGQAVEMRVLTLDQDFFGDIEVFRSNFCCWVWRNDLDDLTRQCIDQPGLTLCQIECLVDGSRREHLPRVIRVLLIKRGYILERERIQGNRICFDIERAGRVKSFAAARRHLIIAHIAHPDQRQRRWETGRAVVVASAQLAQHRDQRFVLQGIDLVDKNHERTRRGFCPCL